MQLGRVGLWTFQLDLQPASAAQEAAAELEELGYPTVWLPEAVGREPFVNSALLLSATERLIVATGIASVWARDAMTMAAGQLTLSEAFAGRFLLGLGVSHQPMVDFVRGHHYDKPLTKMRGLPRRDGQRDLRGAPPRARSRAACWRRSGRRCSSWRRPRPSAPTRTSCRWSTPRSRGRCSATGPMLCPEQAVVLATDPEAARAAARQHMATYLGLPNYTNNLRRLGWGDDDLADGGSDALVDAIVAWGDEAAIVEPGAGPPRRRRRPRLRPGARQRRRRPPDAAVAGARPGPRLAGLTAADAPASAGNLDPRVKVREGARRWREGRERGARAGA